MLMRFEFQKGVWKGGEADQKVCPGAVPRLRPASDIRISLAKKENTL
jgi:hypothetical protein